MAIFHYLRNLKISLNAKKMRISILGKVFNNGISPKEIEDLFTYSEKYLSDGSWLLMDRETKADDNADAFISLYNEKPS